MKNRLPIVIAAAAALVAVGAAPALAATGGAQDTTATFTLSGGDLTLTAQANAALTNRASGSTEISGVLGNVRVTDNRGSETAWVVSTSSTQFVGTGANPSSSTGVRYRSNQPATTGDITFDEEDGVTQFYERMTLVTGASAGRVVVAPSAVYGNNTATWDPYVSVEMPANALADTYSATFTTSIV